MNLETCRFSREEEEALWLRVWQESYGSGGGDPEAAKLVEQLAVQTGTGNGSYDTAWGLRWMWGVKWLNGGRTQYVVGHKYAAALMSSAVVENISEDMAIPRQAFSVMLPEGLLKYEDISFTQINVGIFAIKTEPPMPWIMLEGRRQDGGTVSFCRGATDSAKLFFGEEAKTMLLDSGRDREIKERAMHLASRLVTGVLYTVQHTNNFRTRIYTGNGKKGETRNGPPEHRIYFVGKPISIDCRSEVQRYLSGLKASPPSLQSIVRGHYKRQVIGLSRAGRKVIWIEPYWRGPEDAPILVHPYSVGQ